MMGVAGSGKTTVGKSLAQHLDWDFYDADDFHPPENIEKMANGIALDDSDRVPWLARLHDLISSRQISGSSSSVNATALFAVFFSFVFEMDVFFWNLIWGWFLW